MWEREWARNSKREEEREGVRKSERVKEIAGPYCRLERSDWPVSRYWRVCTTVRRRRPTWSCSLRGSRRGCCPWDWTRRTQCVWRPFGWPVISSNWTSWSPKTVSRYSCTLTLYDVHTVVYITIIAGWVVIKLGLQRVALHQRATMILSSQYDKLHASHIKSLALAKFHTRTANPLSSFPLSLSPLALVTLWT